MSVILYIARHGETDHNLRRVFQGQAKGGPPLNATGRAQAGRLARRLRAAQIDAVVTSDLDRAVETARIVAGPLELHPALEPELREVDVGTWTGKSYAEVEAAYPEEWAAWTAGLDVRRGGGETYSELAARVDRAVSRLVAVHASSRRGREARVVIVSHGGAIKSWVSKILGVSAEGARVLSGVANTALTKVEADGRGRYRLLAWNDTAHLEGGEGPHG